MMEMGKDVLGLKILLQICFIFGLFWISQVIEAVLPVAFPASVIGLLLLLLLLALRIVKSEQIKEVGGFLSGNMGFLLVPICVSIMNYMDLIMEHAVAFFAICVISTVLTFAATALVVQAACRRMEQRKGEQE